MLINISIIERKSRQTSSAIEKKPRYHPVHVGVLRMFGWCMFVGTQKR
jgi:hypothetical protein